MAVTGLAIAGIPQPVSAQVDYNLAVNKVISPESQCQFNDDQVVAVQYESRGTDTISSGTSFPVSYTFNGNTVSETHTLKRDLTNGETVTHYFSGKISVGSISQDQQWYNLKAAVQWSKDQRIADNTLKTAFKNFYSAPIPDSLVGSITCRKEKATLKVNNPRKKSTTRYEWFNRKTNGLPVGKGPVAETPLIYEKPGYDTFYAKRFDSISAPLKFTEIIRGVYANGSFRSGAEIANIADQARDYTGWTVTLWTASTSSSQSLRYPANYEKMNWNLGRFDANEVKPGFGDDEFDYNVFVGRFVWFKAPDPFAGVIVRPDGSVADFVATSASASMIKNMAVEVNGDTITYADVKWSGPSPTKSGYYSPNWAIGDAVERIGNEDNNDASDWKIKYYNNSTYSANPRIVNPKLNLEAFSESTCPSRPKPVAVDVRPNPEPTVFVNKPVCATDTVNLKDTNAFQGQTSLIYQWQVEGKRYQKQTLRHAFPQSSGQYDVKLKATSGVGCQDSITKTLSVNMDPVARMDTVVSCARKTFQLADQSTFADYGLLNKEWQIAGDTFKGRAPDARLSKPDTYNVDLTVTSPAGCSDQTSGTAIIKRAPQTSFTAGDTCAKQAVRLANTTTFRGGVQNLNYRWSTGPDKTFSKASPTPSFANHGQYQFRLTSTAPNGCRDRATKQVAIHPNPYPAFNAFNTCNENEVELDATVRFQGSSDRLSFNWNLGDNSQRNGSALTHTYPDTASYTIGLNVRDTTTGCYNTVTKMVDVKPQPVADFSVGTVCEKDTTRFTYEGDYPAESYQYAFGDGGTSSNPNPYHTFSEAGTYPVTFEVTFRNSQCRQSITDHVKVNPVPEAQFEFDTGAICARDTLEIRNTTKFKADKARLTYDWAFGNRGHAKQKEPPFALAEAGSYPVQLTATTARGCKDRYTRTKLIKPLPDAEFAITRLGNETLKFIAEDRSHAKYEWTIQDSTLAGRTYNKPVIQYKLDSTAGTYSFRLMAENQNGCTNHNRKMASGWPVGLQDQVTDQKSPVKTYPNPFSEQLNVKYEVPRQADVRIGIYNTGGKRLFARSYQNRPAGVYSMSLSTTDQLPDGQSFLLRVQIGDQVYSRKLIRID